MKILLGLLQFKNLTGSEMYVYELARELTKLGHSVTIGYMYGGQGEIVDRVKKLGVNTINLFDLEDSDFDIIHSNQTQTTELLSGFSTPIVQTLHSELLDKYESPFIHPNVKQYICIRESIMEKSLDSGIDGSKLTLIYNGVDEDRFKPVPLPEGKTKYLFVGTKNYLRQQSALHLVNHLREGETVTFMGDGWEIGNKVKHSQVRFIGSKWNVEEEIAKVNIVAGVLMGRTTIEGWMMGRFALIYRINADGNVISRKTPKIPEDLYKFKSSYMVDQVLKVYGKSR